MANFLFENTSNTDIKAIEIIKCPNPSDCNIEKGDERYDFFTIPPDKSKQVNTKCNEICWRYVGGQYKRTTSTIIKV
jgi:hypothetical protein